MSRRNPKRSRRASAPPGRHVPVRLVVGAAAVVVILVAAVILLFGGGGSSSADAGFTAVPTGYPYPVQAIERIADRSHFPVGTVYNNYNSNPPTSGPHAASPATWGIHDEAVPKEQAVHNMEHGGVVVWYNCNAQPILSGDDCTTLRNQLSAVVQPYVGTGKFVLMTPYQDMDHRIALTAWGFLDTFDSFDQARVKAFIDTFICNFNVEHFCS